MMLANGYPELSDCVRLRAAEISRRADMDQLGQVIAQPAGAEQPAAAEVLA